MTMIRPDRRHVIQSAGGVMIAALVGGKTRLLSPSQARAAGATFQVLDDPAMAALAESIGEALVPGAREAGIAHFIDAQLAKPAPECLLIVRYLDVAAPYWPFYRAGLRAWDDAARAAYGQSFVNLGWQQQIDFIAQISTQQPPGWQGPPSPRVYFTLRSDAIDVVYGTEQGFDNLAVPYMPHIPPPKPW